MKSGEEVEVVNWVTRETRKGLVNVVRDNQVWSQERVTPGRRILREEDPEEDRDRNFYLKFLT